MTDSTTVRLEPWPDPEVEACGIHVRDPYVEFCWTWVLGPTQVLMLRWAAFAIDAAKGPVTVNLAEVAKSLGLGVGTARHSAIARSLRRLEQYRFALELPGGWALRQHAWPLPERLVQRAPQPVVVLDRMFAKQRHPSHHAA